MREEARALRRVDAATATRVADTTTMDETMNDAADHPPRPTDSDSTRKAWVPPVLTVHRSLTALTQAQYPQGIPIDSTDGGPQRAVPCSQGFCP